jgi:hypothetical protein
MARLARDDNRDIGHCAMIRKWRCRPAKVASLQRKWRHPGMAPKLASSPRVADVAAAVRVAKLASEVRVPA